MIVDPSVVPGLPFLLAKLVPGDLLSDNESTALAGYARGVWRLAETADHAVSFVEQEDLAVGAGAKPQVRARDLGQLLLMSAFLH